MDIEAHPFDLRECVESALDLVAPRAVEKHLDTAYVFEGDVPAAIVGDVDAAAPDPAQPAHQRGEVHRARRGRADRRAPTPADADAVELHVRRARHRHRTFARTRWRASSSRSRRPTRRRRASTAAPASGLAISRRLAELMGGRMWARERRPGQGLDVPVHDRRAGRRRCRRRASATSSACSPSSPASAC